MCLAVPGELVRIEEHDDPLWRWGDVRFGGVLRQVSLACVPQARIGDRLLVHVGMALTVLEPEDGTNHPEPTAQELG
jgi:hydrogenase expression/formation protein HypC